MKLLILTEGGRNIGFGHVTRCLSLYQAFEENNITPLLFVNGDDTVKTLLKGANYKIFNWLKEKEELFRQASGADIAVIDSYLADISFYETISGLVKKAVYIDDNKCLDYPPGTVVNGSIFADELNYPVKDGVTYLLGTRYIPIRKEFWDMPERAINKEPKNALITFGGMEYPGLIRRLVDFLKGKFGVKFNAINAAGAKKIRSLMLEADLCISGGGQTTYELARCGLPAIGVCFADNQLFNLKGWSKAGSLEFAGWHHERDLFGKIEGALIKASSYEKRFEMSLAGQRFVDGQGAGRVAQEVLK